MDFITEFKQREFLEQATNLEDLQKLMQTKSIVAYGGFDCTAKSLHVGNLMLIMAMRLLQKHGHKPLIIVGGATTKIGDPSGKDSARKMLSDEIIQENMVSIKEILEKFLKFGDGPHDAVILNNENWLNDLGYLEFLKNYGRFFSINRMLTFESVKARLEREQNLSFLEFNYMLLQAFDFAELYKSYNCRLQLGGSDQWGNIINGIELSRKLGNKEELYGLTTPLITTSSGVKMGKSEKGAYWLREDMLSSYDYYQFWRNCDDNDVIKFMKIYTDIPIEEINNYSLKKGSELNEVKKILAYEATKLCHGKEKAKEAEETAIKVFEQGQLGEAIPEYNLKLSELDENLSAYQLFAKSGLVSSGGEAKRLIKGAGAKINDDIINDPMMIIERKFINNNIIKLTAGKKRHLIIRVID